MYFQNLKQAFWIIYTYQGNESIVHLLTSIVQEQKQQRAPRHFDAIEDAESKSAYSPASTKRKTCARVARR